MDLSKLSDADLLAVKAGDLSKVSEAGLLALKGAPEPSLMDGVKQVGKDMAAGAVRGAGSIGATILAPVDAAARAMGVQNSFIGRTDRREAMDAGLRSLGADTDSLAYQGGKLGAEIAGTAGVGGALAKGVATIPAVASKAPLLAEALRTSGMNLGGTTGSKLADMGLRMAAGGATGAASAGLINPQDAAAGGAIGAALPPAMAAGAKLGEAVGSKVASRYADALAKYNRNAPLNQTVKESIDAGYVIPPNMVNPSFKNQVIESISGKQATEQLASTRNSDTTAKLVRESLKMADDAPLSRSALESIRKAEGGTYAKVAGLSQQAADDLEALKIARNDAQGWFKAYNRSASPDDLAKAKAARTLAETLEQSLEQHAKAAGQDELIPALKEARKQIAKTYTVERALHEGSGTIDARVLGRMYDKGSPLSDGLDTVGKFASAFPKVAKTAESVGSPAAHNLKSLASVLMGGGGMAAGGPVGAVAGAAYPFLAPPVARSIMFRKGAQEALVQGAPQMGNAAKLAELLQNPEMQLLLARSAPAIVADR
jgi:hypothetical protein